MSVEKVRAYLEHFGVSDRIREFDVSSATVELAAVAVGVEPARIAKTLSFKLGEDPILVVTAGDAKIDNSKYKHFFGMKAKMLTPDEAVERIEAAAKEAVTKAAQCVVPMPEHFHMEIDFVKHHVAYSKSFYPGATLKDDKFVCFDSDDWYEVLRFCHFVLSDG